MKTDLCADDVVMHLTPHPQTITSEVPGSMLAAMATPGAGRGAGSAALECGRRLLLAARAGDTHTVRQLMAKGAPFTTDWLGTSPLHLAAGGDHVETVSVLLRAGVSRDARNKVSRTALHVAAAAGHARVVRALLQAGAACHAADMLQMTPLHWAVRGGHVAAASALLAAGADPLALSKFRQSPLSLARELAAAGRPQLRRVIDAALQQREADAAANVAIAPEQTAEESPTTIDAEIVQSVQSIEPRTPTKRKTPPQREKSAVKIDSKPEAAAEAEAGADSSQVEPGAAALLRRHGITLLPTDDGSTVLSALQSGRTVVLSDAGKLMLKDASAVTTTATAAGGGGAGAGVVLTATPVSAPPPGVKVFTLSSSARVLPAATPAATTTTKDTQPAATPPARNDLQQVKLVQLASDTPPAGGVAGAGGGAGGGAARPAVRIIMNKHNLRKLITTALRASAPEGWSEEDLWSDSESEGGESVVTVPEQFVRSGSAQYLRSQLLCAHAALQHLVARLATRQRRRP